MKQVWQTIDGALFGDATDAEKHEREIRDRCRMWEKDGTPTDIALNAFIVHLIGDNAGQIFLDIAKAQDSEDYCEGIEPDISGWFLWDEGYETYRWIDPDTIAALAHLWISETYISD